MTPLMKKLDQCRAEIAGLQGQLDEPICSQQSRAELRLTLVAQIDSWHDRAADRVAADLQKLAYGVDVDLMMSEVQEREVAQGFALAEQAADVRAWITLAVGKEAMLARLEPRLAEMPEGVDAATRAQRCDEIARQIVECEVREEALLRQAAAQGDILDPRPGARVEAAILLGWSAA